MSSSNPGFLPSPHLQTPSHHGLKLQYVNWRTSLVAQIVNHLPAMQETWVLSLDQEDPLEKGMATHSNILAWRIPWTQDPGRLQSMESQRVRYD